jgi:hypothetical protein
MLDAVEQTANMRAGGPTVQPEPGTQVQSEAALARENERAMRELQKMMGGV